MLDFKSKGLEFKSWWGLTKIDLKKILPWRILISSDFEPLGGQLWGLDGNLVGKLLFIQIHFGVLCGMSFHAVMIFSLGLATLLDSSSAHCDYLKIMLVRNIGMNTRACLANWENFWPSCKWILNKLMPTQVFNTDNPEKQSLKESYEFSEIFM